MGDNRKPRHLTWIHGLHELFELSYFTYFIEALTPSLIDIAILEDLLVLPA